MSLFVFFPNRQSFCSFHFWLTARIKMQTMSSDTNFTARVAVLGQVAGKSTLIARLLKHPIPTSYQPSPCYAHLYGFADPNVQPSRGMASTPFTNDGVGLMFFEIGGNYGTRNPFRAQRIFQRDVSVVVIDLTSSLEDEVWIKEVREFLYIARYPLCDKHPRCLLVIGTSLHPNNPPKTDEILNQAIDKDPYNGEATQFRRLSPMLATDEEIDDLRKDLFDIARFVKQRNPSTSIPQPQLQEQWWSPSCVIS